MIQLAYVSSAVRLFTPEDIEDILTTSRRKNGGLGVTGMLLYKEGNLLQVLEGKEQAVRQLYSIIEQDPRHRGVICLFLKPISERDFPEWTMGFSDLKALPARKLEGYSHFLESGFDPKQLKAGEALQLLKSFKTHVR